LTSIFFYKRLR